jgi:hypothetical protein
MPLDFLLQPGTKKKRVLLRETFFATKLEEEAEGRSLHTRERRMARRKKKSLLHSPTPRAPLAWTEHTTSETPLHIREMRESISMSVRKKWSESGILNRDKEEGVRSGPAAARR